MIAKEEAEDLGTLAIGPWEAMVLIENEQEAFLDRVEEGLEPAMV